jgi:hypothetical protein
VAVASDSWKASHIAASGRVGGDRAGTAGRPVVAAFPHSADRRQLPWHGDRPSGRPGGGRAVPKQLASLLPAERQASSCVLEILPEDQFLTYGLGVSLMQMRSPSAARARVPVGSPGGQSGMHANAATPHHG